MAQLVFRADLTKWAVRRLKILVVFAAIAAVFWLSYNGEHELVDLVAALFFAVVGAVLFLVDIMLPPRITISDGELKMRRSRFRFDDVIDVNHYKDEYVFYLASRKRVVVNLSVFSNADKKEMNRILAAECMRHLADEKIREKIAKASDISGLEFTVRAKHSVLPYIFLLFMEMFGLLFVFTYAVMFIGGNVGGAGLLFLVLWFGITGIFYILDKRAAKWVFSFREDMFTFSRRGKVKFTFPRTDIQGVSFKPLGQNFIQFRTANGKKYALPLQSFARKDRKRLEENIRRIFFLPEQGKKTLFNIKL